MKMSLDALAVSVVIALTACGPQSMEETAPSTEASAPVATTEDAIAPVACSGLNGVFTGTANRTGTSGGTSPFCPGSSARSLSFTSGNVTIAPVGPGGEAQVAATIDLGALSGCDFQAVTSTFIGGRSVVYTYKLKSQVNGSLAGILNIDTTSTSVASDACSASYSVVLN